MEISKAEIASAAAAFSAASQTPATSATPHDLPDEELLPLRMSDLPLRIEGTVLEGRIKQLQAELERVLTTPELDAARSEGSDLTRQAAALDVLTKQANGYFYGGQLGVNMIYGVKTAFETMTEGLQINQRVDAESLATITTVELVD